MNDSKEKLSKKEIRFFKSFEFILELLEGIAIAASPTLIGLISAAIVYNYLPTETGYNIGVYIVLLGILLGIFWAYRIWKRNGTVWFLSRVQASTELDDTTEKSKKKVDH